MAAVTHLNLRLVIPQKLRAGEEPLYKAAQRFFAEQGCAMYLQEKLMRLSPGLPAVVEGVVTPGALEAFLLQMPHVDRVIVLTSPGEAASLAQVA